jgi:hypothetical protein
MAIGVYVTGGLERLTKKQLIEACEFDVVAMLDANGKRTGKITGTFRTDCGMDTKIYNAVPGGYLSSELGPQTKMAGEIRTVLTGLGVVAAVASADIALALGFA